MDLRKGGLEKGAKFEEIFEVMVRIFGFNVEFSNRGIDLTNRGNARGQKSGNQ
jgi:hypothetical protein